MKLFKAVGIVLDSLVTTTVTILEAVTIGADATKDLSKMAKQTTESMLAEQALEARKELLLLQGSITEVEVLEADVKL